MMEKAFIFKQFQKETEPVFSDLLSQLFVCIVFYRIKN